MGRVGAGWRIERGGAPAFLRSDKTPPKSVERRYGSDAAMLRSASFAGLVLWPAPQARRTRPSNITAEGLAARRHKRRKSNHRGIKPLLHSSQVSRELGG